jgi:hypothetical protein
MDYDENIVALGEDVDSDDERMPHRLKGASSSERLPVSPILLSLSTDNIITPLTDYLAPPLFYSTAVAIRSR